MSKPNFEGVVRIPAGAQDARLETLLDMPECKTDGHQRFVEAAGYILDNLKTIERTPVGIHLLGKPGSGKTFAAVALARAVYEQADNTFVSVQNMKTTPNLTFANAYSGEKSHWNPFNPGFGIGVGVLDDVQNDIRSREVFFSAIDDVNHEGGLLIVTSNETDPMFYRDSPESHKTTNDYMAEDFLKDRVDMSRPVADRNEENEQQRIFSRISGTMMPIIFDTSVDLRATGGFWKDF
ncbi:hypothetical protein BH23PAT2_BH23PAT2_08850 [soil metagenome]